MEHTEGKLELHYQGGRVYLECNTPQGKVRVAEMVMGWRTDSNADAKYIIKCWNEHDALLEACKNLYKMVDHDELISTSVLVSYMQNAEQAITEAEKEL